MSYSKTNSNDQVMTKLLIKLLTKFAWVIVGLRHDSGIRHDYFPITRIEYEVNSKFEE
jgi:hypothetical protein